MTPYTYIHTHIYIYIFFFEEEKHTVSSERCHTVYYYSRHYNFSGKIIPYNDSVSDTGFRVVC